MIILENSTAKALIHTKGAELQSFYRKDLSLEYIWDGDAAFWPRHSPLLFPIVGGLKDDTYSYKGKDYTLARHGFARDMEFELENQSTQSATFVLRSSEETLKNYPFHFILKVSYTLDENRITIKYEVENTSDETMYFSIGTHPAFNVPLTEGTVYTDYFLEFEQEENSVRYTLHGNLLNGTVPYLQNQQKLPLKKELFYEDALVFKDLKSISITIKSEKSDNGLKLKFAGFPYMGIWAAKDAPFVCIEPWCGLADSENHNQKIEEKEGIIALAKARKWAVNWSLEVF